MARADGYRDPDGVDLPDVDLTADEFLHVMAIAQETIPGGEPAHYTLVSAGIPYIRGFWKPGCPICESIVAKGEKLLDDAERRGLVPGVIPPRL